MTFQKHVSCATTVAVLITLAGCTVGPKHSAPGVPAPAAYSSVPGGSGTLNSAPLAGGLSPGGAAEWWTNFNDPMLTSLVARAVEGNKDLQIAAQRVRESRALRGVEAGALQPTVDARGSATRHRQSQTSGGPGSNSNGSSLFDVGLDASWELDVFGGLRRGVEAADADLQAAEEARRNVLVSLAAEVARNYAEYRGYQARAALAERTIASQRSTLEVAESRSKAGLWADIESEQARAQLATRESQLPPLVSGQRAAAFRLAVLLGLQPAALLGELAPLQDVPHPPAQVPVGLPSDLLRRRPDIREAERRLAAATARIGVATAQLYPKFYLTGGVGLQSGELASVPDSASAVWSIGPSIRWNVFSGGRTRAAIEAAGAREKQALLTFERAWLTSLEDVEGSMTAFVQEQSRRERLAAAVASNRRAVDLADARWKNGIGDFLTVLINQRQLFDSEDQLVQSETAVTTSLIRLYKALGGGWDDREAQAVAMPQDAPG